MSTTTHRKQYDPPGPGTWTLDASHCERPHSRFAGSYTDQYTAGMRAGMERYGILLETIELGLVDGFVYTAVRPLGAPPDAKGTPPRFLFKLLTWLHPAVRRRIRRAEEVVRQRLWRQDARLFSEEYAPMMRAKLRALQAVELEPLGTEELVTHVEEVRRAGESDLFEHFRHAAAAMIPVGDFIASVREWTSCTVEEALGTLTGHSPHSVDAVEALDAVVEAVAADPGSPGVLAERDPVTVLARLRSAPGPVGSAARAWLDLVEHRILTGHDVADKRALEVPGTLVDSLRARLNGPRASDVATETQRRAEALRARVPQANRARFDELLADARIGHPLRDGRCLLATWTLGLARRALLEAARRLAARGSLEDTEHVVDLDPAELAVLLHGEAGPSAAEVAARFQARQNRTCSDMPDRLGPEPAPPPPPEWLPPAAARLQRAMATYLDAMFVEGKGKRDARSVDGIPASPGRYQGPARVVRTPSDFDRIRKGDVLVARLTSPAYNAVLPLVGAIVTERGGLLSHPAIVSREFGIPGVVGARGAVDLLPEGALVEVDGDAGVVRVLA